MIQTFIPRDPIVPNTSYTVEDLIFRSLANSDNSANGLLVEYIRYIQGDRDLFSEINRDLGIIETSDSTTSAVTTKGYSSIFRMLYNASFLNPESSEKLLDIMSHSYFEKGLRAGVPNNIKISHKFGERFLDNGEKQLHDCGIIYYPDNPYLLCVMTKGRDFGKLEKIISWISKETYEEFHSRRIGD
jgi:beta-lactamase class A